MELHPDGPCGRYGAIAGGADGPPLPKQPRRHYAPGGNDTIAGSVTGTKPRRMARGDAGKQIMVPITGTQHEISAGDYRATVTELGAGLRALHYLGRPVIGEYDPDVLPPGASGQLLAPWPNRVDGGRYAINGTRY